MEQRNKWYAICLCRNFTVGSFIASATYTFIGIIKSIPFFSILVRCPNDTLLTCTVHNTTPLVDEDNLLYITRLAAYTTFNI